jgi:regulator of replication initiation timing
MSKRQLIVLARRRNHDLAVENEHLRRELAKKQRECHELEDANVNVRVERDVTDELLGHILDQRSGAQ